MKKIEKISTITCLILVGLALIFFALGVFDQNLSTSKFYLTLFNCAWISAAIVILVTLLVDILKTLRDINKIKNKNLLLK